MCVDCERETPDRFKLSLREAVAVFHGCFVLESVFDSFSKLNADHARMLLEMLDHVVSDASVHSNNELGVICKRYGEDPELFVESYQFPHFDGAQLGVVYRDGGHQIYDFSFPCDKASSQQMMHFGRLIRSIDSVVEEHLRRSDR